MSDSYQRIERGLRKMLTIVPKIPLFASPARNNELARVLGLLAIAFLIFQYPITTIVCVLGLAWLLGGEG